MRCGEKHIEIVESYHLSLGCRRGLAAEPAIDQAALAMALTVEPVGGSRVFGGDDETQRSVIVQAGLVAVEARLTVLEGSRGRRVSTR